MSRGGLRYHAGVTLDPVKQWTLVCGGLVAHADGVLDGSECERLMGLLEAADGVDGDEYGAWISAIGSPARLEELLEVLDPPDAEHHRELLEGAWVMAVVDGIRTPEEGAMIERLAGRLGVEPVQLEYWRDAWAVAEREFATGVAAVLGFVLGAGAPVLERERAGVRDALWATPCEQALRDELIARAMAPTTRDEAARNLASLARSRRIAAMQRCVDAARRSADPAAAKARHLEVAWAASVPAQSVERWFA
jgi:tellurite resistance protein